MLCLQHSLKIGDHRKLKKFVRVWIKLRDLSDEFQQVNASLFLCHLGFFIIDGVSKAYLIITISSGQIKGRELFTFSLIINAIIIVQIYMEVAQRVFFKVIIYLIIIS